MRAYKVYERNLPHLNDVLLMLGPVGVLVCGQSVWRLDPEALNKKLKQLVHSCEGLVRHEEGFDECGVCSSIWVNKVRVW